MELKPELVNAKTLGENMRPVAAHTRQNIETIEGKRMRKELTRRSE